MLLLANKLGRQAVAQSTCKRFEINARVWSQHRVEVYRRALQTSFLFAKETAVLAAIAILYNLQRSTDSALPTVIAVLGGYLAFSAVLITLAVSYHGAYRANFKCWISDGNLHLRRGGLHVRTFHIPVDEIATVTIVQNRFARMFKLFDIEIVPRTPEFHERTVISGLDARSAAELHGELLSRKTRRRKSA